MKKYKIAFFVELKKFENNFSDWKELNLGNPGIGGTHYLFLLTVKYLNQIYGDNYAVLLTNTRKKIKDINIPTEFCESERDAIDFCESNDIGFLTLNANIISKINCNILENTKVKILVWGHNTIDKKTRQKAIKHKSIYKIICVSEQQYLNMKDSKCFPKCTYINNVIPPEFYNNSKLSNSFSKNVIYIGSIFPQKGLHNLLKIWRKVEKKVENAKLIVIGGSKVWNPNQELGKLNISDKYYDKVLYKCLKRIKKKENVLFLGPKGWNEINEIILNCSVGVVNPSYYFRDETFCMSAIEMACYGLPIVSRKRNDGLNSTIVNDKTGFLKKHDREIANSIVELLNNKEKCNQFGINAREFASKFIINEEIKKWNTLINSKDMYNKNNKRLYWDKDVWLLRHDFILKLFYYIKTGKIFGVLKKKKRK